MKHLAGAFIAAVLGAAPAAAQDGDIRAVISARTADSAGGLYMYEVSGLADLESCLALAWAHSVRINELDRANAMNVTCLQNGRIIGAQACHNGVCNGIGLVPGKVN
jgi:hypothetical protein